MLLCLALLACGDEEDFVEEEQVDDADEDADCWGCEGCEVIVSRVTGGDAAFLRGADGLAALSGGGLNPSSLPG